MDIISAATLLFLVMDPLGNIPVFLSVLDKVAPERRTKVLIRELLFAQPTRKNDRLVAGAAGGLGSFIGDPDISNQSQAIPGVARSDCDRTPDGYAADRFSRADVAGRDICLHGRIDLNLNCCASKLLL